MATMPQRVRRFLDEDASTFAFTSALGVGAFLTRELRASSPSPSSTTLRQLQLAARKTLPMLPIIAASSAVGIVGFKLMTGIVQDVRRDYSRTSLMIAVPLFAAIVHAPGGVRLMAKSAVGYGGLILAADYAAFHWHRYQHALQLEQQPHEQDDRVMGHLHDSDAWRATGLGLERPVLLAPSLSNE